MTSVKLLPTLRDSVDWASVRVPLVIAVPMQVSII